MAIDKYGNELPASPGYKRVIGNDGVTLKEEEVIFLGPTISATAVTGGTQLDATSVPAGSVTLAEMADLAAHSVIGNSTASAATPTALTATAIGLGVLAAATQAALTALIALATTSLAGLLSAADKTKLDTQEVAHDAAFNASSVSVTWAAGRYKFIKIKMTTISGNAASPTLVFGGVTMTSNVFGTAGYLSNGGSTGAGTGLWTQANQWVTSNIALLKMGQAAFMEGDVAFNIDGANMAWTGTSDGQLTVIGSAGLGGATDATGCTGLTITFGGATVGRLHIIGVL